MRGLDRGLKLLNTMKIEARPLSLHELFQITGISKPSLLRILETMAAHNLVRRGIEDSLYRLCVRLDSTPQLSAQNEATATAAAPVLDALSMKIKWPTELIVLNGDHMEILESTRVRSPFHLNRMHIGKDVDLVFSGAGRAYLAFAPEEEAAAILLRLAENGPFPVRSFIRSGGARQAIEKTRQQGYGERDPSMSMIGRTDPDGTWGISVPLLGKTQIYGCVSLIWVYRAVRTETIVADYLQDLIEAASRIVNNIER